ncbi:hypothetical protein MNB_SV-13-299 [hydrothermal vent metagenome]|uniref:Uncharacterized protein n=1 Tax=hydrothermal vent metagenome TaxID=652676 RepID=A0A1W1CY69_9ZZZZ
MKLTTPFLSLLINFLLGVSWAFAMLGASTLFFIFLQIGIFYSLFGSLIGALPGLFFVLLIEYFLMRQEKLNELKKQTKLLEELVAQNKS